MQQPPSPPSLLLTLVLGLWIVVGPSPALAVTTTPDNTLGQSLVYPKDANILLGALFPIHTRQRDVATGVNVCGELQDEEGIQPLEAMLYTLDQINEDPDLLPGVKLGALVMDSCNAPNLALNQTLGFIKGYLAGHNKYHQSEFTCGDGSAPTYRGGEFDKVVGVIGGQQSSVSVQMASVLRVIELPQISYLSTSATLSNKDRYPFFLRTVPSDTTQAQAILRVLQDFKWTYASIVYSSGEYGEGGFHQLLKKASEYNVCFPTPHHRLSSDDSEDDYKRVVTALIKGKANVVVVFAEKQVALRLLETVRLRGQQNRFLWLGSDGWSSSSLMNVEAVAEGAISVQPLIRSLPGFDEYFTNLTPVTNTRNPWFTEYWQHLGCALDAPTCPSVGENYRQVPWLHFVRDSVIAFAHALHTMWEDKCKGRKGLCEAMVHNGHIHGQDLYNHLLNVQFPDVSNSTFRFVSSGSGPARYSVLNYQHDDHYAYSWTKVGTYTNTTGATAELHLDMDSVKYRDSQDFPESSCGIPCKPGQAKILMTDKCCWYCKNCQSYQYLNTTTQLCVDCGECMKPEVGQEKCVDKEEKFIDYKNRWAITSLAFASIGIFSTVLVGVIFWVHLDTPVIKASSRELSYILLGGIFFSFVMSFVIVAPPSRMTCGLTRFFLGFIYTVCYAAILTKTNRISRIFNQNITKSQKAKFTSPFSQVVIVSLLVSVEVIINVVWLLMHNPDIKYMCDRASDFRTRICGGLDDYTYIVGLIYPSLLVLLCTLYAIKTRKCPDGFNEARYIAFTNYTTCLIWLVFVPLYLSTGSSDDIRIVTLAMFLSLGGFVQLGCLFFPKVYIVLFKPEKNTRDVIMSVKRNSYPVDTSFKTSGRFPSLPLQERPALQSSPAIFFHNGAMDSPLETQKHPAKAAAISAGATGTVVLCPPRHTSKTLPPLSTETPRRASKMFLSVIQNKDSDPPAF
uniref:Metabotropic glutamate receptor type 3 n=1 Tax=Homarus americanus TaxID=6706 RepID=A0A1J0FAW0_HOMAM|nr:metabotropic glutamate receptor type 3 [Homarus americanus]